MIEVKVGVIGPTDLQKQSKLLGKPVEFLLERARFVGKALAEHGAELWVNGDGGMLAEVARAYKENAGPHLVVLYPRYEVPWPTAHTAPYIGLADETIRTSDWFQANYLVVSDTELCVCVGLSSGTYSELAYIKWNLQFDRGNLKVLVIIQELMRLRRLPLEIRAYLEEIARYIPQVEDLVHALEKVDCNDKEPIPV